MIDKDILDEVLPVPELETLKEQTIGELKEEGFAITNFHSGGVFYTLLLIVLRVKVEFTELLRDVLNNMFLTHASGVWVDLKAADYGKKRKKAQKTQGLVTLSRTNDQGEAVKIPKGHVFKTEKDVNGEELRFFVLEAAVLQKGARSVDVLVEAEKEGSRYNVPEAQITRSLTFLNGVDEVTNSKDWITREGSDTEDDESLRTRGLRSWSELAARSIEDTFINTAEVSGEEDARCQEGCRDTHPCRQVKPAGAGSGCGPCRRIAQDAFVQRFEAMLRQVVRQPPADISEFVVHSSRVSFSFSFCTAWW